MEAAEAAFGDELEDEDWEREQKILPPSRALAALRRRAGRSGSRPRTRSTCRSRAASCRAPASRGSACCRRTGAAGSCATSCAASSRTSAAGASRSRLSGRRSRRSTAASATAWLRRASSRSPTRAASRSRTTRPRASPSGSSTPRRRTGSSRRSTTASARPRGHALALGDVVEGAAARRSRRSGARREPEVLRRRRGRRRRPRATRSTASRTSGRTASPRARCASSSSSRPRARSSASSGASCIGIDLTTKVDVFSLDPASTLFLNVRDPRALGLRLGDALWLRLVDLDAALRARSYKPGESIVLEVTDELCPWNDGRYRVGDDAGRTEDTADLALDVGRSRGRVPRRLRLPPARPRRSRLGAPRGRGRGGDAALPDRPAARTARRCSGGLGRSRPTADLDEFKRAVGAIGHYFGGLAPDDEAAQRFSSNLPLERMHAAFDGDRIVGGAGAFPFELTVPGGTGPLRRRHRRRRPADAPPPRHPHGDDAHAARGHPGARASRSPRSGPRRR